MLALLGNFTFETQDNGFQDIKEKLSFKYAEHEKALGFRSDEKVGKYSEEFELSGTLILQKIDSLENLKQLGKDGKPVLLVFGSGHAYWVTIRDMEVDSSRFLNTGEALKRKFKVTLKRYYYEQSVFSKIFSAF